MRHTLRSYFSSGCLAFALALAILASSAARANELASLPHPWPAPVGHFQPRAGVYTPGSYANHAVQNELQQYNEQQQRSDRALDQKLNLCRC
jgi:hypothetical protein